MLFVCLSCWDWIPRLMRIALLALDGMGWEGGWRDISIPASLEAQVVFFQSFATKQTLC